jgi:integrase
MAVRKRHRPECAHRKDKRKRCNCDGPWQARIPDPDRPGTTYKIEKQFRLKTEAEAWERAQRSDQQRGEWIDPRKAERTLNEVIQAWRESWPNRLSSGTQSLYDSIIATHIESTFGPVAIGKIDHGKVQRWVNQLTAGGRAAGTVRNAYGCLRSALNTAVRYGWLRTNPCSTAIDLPRARREEMLCLSATELRDLAERIDPHYRTLIYTAGYSGLRAGELLALTRADVDLLRGKITVRRALKDINGHLEVGEVKTASSRRTVSLPASLVAMLREHLASALPGGSGPEALVFPSKTGKHIRHRLLVRRHFRSAVAGHTDKEGEYHPGALPPRLHGLRFHDLRHTAASLAIHAGAHPLLVSKQLGHSSVQITLDRYSHLMPNAAEALAEKLDALIIAAAAELEPSNVTPLRV